VATVNFSVPDDVKKAFDRAFKKRNKSAVIADLMRRAVAEEERQKQRIELFRQLTERRRLRPKVTEKEIRAARSFGRP
jgi:metal-responsive CopG/Arc/MetJ family transcriptional regulator